MDIKCRTQRLHRRQDFCGNAVTPAFHRIRRLGSEICIRKGALTKPDMGQFVGKSEDLCSPCVSTIYKHQGCHGVDKRKSPELFRIQLAMGVASHHTADHDQHSDFFGLISQVGKCVRPTPSSHVDFKRECCCDLSSCFHRWNGSGHRTNLRNLAESDTAGIVAVPVLSLLALVDGVEKIRTRTNDRLVPDGSKVGYRDVVFWRRLQEEVANRRASRSRETLQLLQGGSQLARLPLRQLGKLARELLIVKARAFAGPCKQSGLNVNPNCHAYPSPLTIRRGRAHHSHAPITKPYLPTTEVLAQISSSTDVGSQSRMLGCVTWLGEGGNGDHDH